MSPLDEMDASEQAAALESTLRCLLDAVAWDDVQEVGGKPLTDAIRDAHKLLGTEEDV